MDIKVIIILCVHLEDAHPVPGARLEGSSQGEAAGDGGGRRVGVRGVREHHLGEGAWFGVWCPGGALHADLRSVNTSQSMVNT